MYDTPTQDPVAWKRGSNRNRNNQKNKNSVLNPRDCQRQTGRTAGKPTPCQHHDSHGASPLLDGNRIYYTIEDVTFLSWVSLAFCLCLLLTKDDSDRQKRNTLGRIVPSVVRRSNSANAIPVYFPHCLVQLTVRTLCGYQRYMHVVMG